MKIVSLNVGAPSTRRYGGQELRTGGAKRPVSRAMVRFDNFDGDGQADLVSQPRMPCGKLAARNGERMLARWISETGYTGFYMRLLSEGPVAAGDTFDIVERHPDRISIADVSGVIYGRSPDITPIERPAGPPGFAERAEQLRRSVQWV